MGLTWNKAISSRNFPQLLIFRQARAVLLQLQVSASSPFGGLVARPGVMWRPPGDHVSIIHCCAPFLRWHLVDADAVLANACAQMVMAWRDTAELP